MHRKEKERKILEAIQAKKSEEDKIQKKMKSKRLNILNHIFGFSDKSSDANNNNNHSTNKNKEIQQNNIILEQKIQVEQKVDEDKRHDISMTEEVDFIEKKQKKKYKE